MPPDIIFHVPYNSAHLGISTHVRFYFCGSINIFDDLAVPF